MNVSCGQCQTVFRVDPDKVPVNGVRARCSVCAAVFWVRREAPPAPAPVSVPVSVPAPPVPMPLPQAEPLPTPPPFRMPAPAYARPAAAGSPPVAAPSPSPPPGPAVSPAPRRAPAPPPAAPVVAAPAPAPSVAAAPPSSGRSPRPANPFLSQDPKARARRLARALVSDIVVYHPAKRRDGLRDGSLKLLFEEEIRKSWEEYIEQVGRELAESTTFFTDALNDILADGQPVFP